MTKLLGLLLGTLAVAACSNPCHDYCEDYMKKTQQCGLGGPSGDSEVDLCADEANKVFTHDMCSAADDNIKNMSCDDFKGLVCSDSSASASGYMCQ